LYKAIECVPYCTIIWLALAKIEVYKNAKKVLNNAIKNNPTDFTIWMSAAKLEEAEGNNENVGKLVQSAMTHLEK
jgi:pre-mRNA-processing factor 6